MKTLLQVLVLSLFSQSSVFSQSPVVQSILEEMKIDSIIYFARELTGDIATVINGTPYTIQSRHKNQPGNDMAANYIQQKLESYGLEVHNQSFSSTGRNVYAIQPGTDFPNQKYIICAHYDDMPSGSLAPGADDNGSGTVSVLEAARVLSQHSFPYTILYALWDEEEQGLVGAEFFAQNAASQGDSILGVINMDMIAWDSNDDGNADVHTRPVANSDDLKDKMLENNSLYGINLDLDVIDPGASYSDHAAFWASGFGAILLIEDDNDFHAFYHTVNDLIIYYNHPYLEKMAKLSVATLATFALNLDLRIIHTPIASRDNTDDIECSAEVITGLDIGTGNASPRLYYRSNQGAVWSEFYEVIGNSANISATYNFTIPGQSLGTIVQYYIAAQDLDSSIVATLPIGGGGYNPPGSTPPQDLFQFFVATTSIAFADSAMSTGNWTATGNWDITTQKYVSAPSSFTDSPNGNYPNNYTAAFEYDGTVDLTDILGATIEFQSQWDIETDWDYGQFQISTNQGNTWIPMEGLYTNPGTGSFQPNGEPVYDGSQLSWVNESIDLSEYIGEQITFRFLLKSDGYVTEDGWYIDDLKVIIYQSVPVNVNDIAGMINDYSLEQNYPNPFNPSTKIVFQVPQSVNVSLKIYDVLGNEIVTLVNEEKGPGKYEIDFNASHLSSGIYFYTLWAGTYISIKKMVLIK
jgi:hypothetical protein